MRLRDALDRTLSIGRIAANNGNSWGGDQTDTFTTVISSVPCRLEITDVDQYTVWLMTEDALPRVGDLFEIDGWTPQIEVMRIKTNTSADGSFHHFEVTGKPMYPTRRFVDA